MQLCPRCSKHKKRIGDNICDDCAMNEKYTQWGRGQRGSTMNECENCGIPILYPIHCRNCGYYKREVQ